MRTILSAPPHISPAVLVIAMTIALAAPASAWQTAHGDPDNTGTVDVPTAPAANTAATVPGLGGIAPGAAPVIAPDGTLYIGNMRGQLRSFGPGGEARWSIDIGGFQQIRTSPALGSDGSIYVVGEATVRDNTTDPATQRTVLDLQKYTANGGLLWRRSVPGQGPTNPASAPPNILTVGGSDVVIVPSGSPYRARLTAFSADSGQILADQVVSDRWGDVTGTSDVYCPFCNGIGQTLEGRHPDSLPPLTMPFPAAAIFAPPGGETLIMMSDGFQDLVGYAFTGNTFEERFRVHDDKRYVTSPPLAWPDGHAMINTTLKDHLDPQVMYAGLGFSTNRAKGLYSLASPTELGGSRHAVVSVGNGLAIMSGVTILKQITLPGGSAAAAAASRTHLFVSTVAGLHSFDKATLKKVASFSWTKGGTSQPVIGPQGHVYAIARDTLHVFPPPVSGGRVVGAGTLPDILPAERVQPGVAGTAAAEGTILQSDILPTEQVQPGVAGSAVAEGTILQSDIQPTTPLAPAEIPETVSKQTYKPPVLASGNRLFACLELDGDECGNAQMRDVAENFCRAQGFDRAEDLDVDSRKVVAETLDGRFCSKKKCRVFDEIVCRR